MNRGRRGENIFSGKSEKWDRRIILDTKD